VIFFAFAWVIVGVVIIVLVYVDIFLTVLHPSVESPLSNRFQQTIWRGLQVMARVLPTDTQRHALLGLGLPLMVAGLIVFWLLLLSVGFACLYTPWIGDPTVFSADSALGGFFDALYYSSVTLATLGYGDLLPLTPAFRTLAVFEALTGAVTISAAVAYILAVYPALAEQRTLARTLNAEVAGQSDALPMLRRYLMSDGNWHSDLFTTIRELAFALLNISESHETHSVLYYAHARHVQHSFVRMLITAQSLVSTLRYSLSVDHHPDTVNNPHVLLLEQSLHYSLNQLSKSVHVTLPGAVSDNGQQYAAAYAHVCDVVEQIGLKSSRVQRTLAVPVLVESEAEEQSGDENAVQRVRAAETFAYDGDPSVLDPALDLASATPEQAYAVFRQQTDPRIAAYALACGYGIEEARASTSTTWWTGAR
jgi:voltage-gated potassium channel Kch